MEDDIPELGIEVDLKKLNYAQLRELLKKSLHIPDVFTEYRYVDDPNIQYLLNADVHRIVNNSIRMERKVICENESLNTFDESLQRRLTLEHLFKVYLSMTLKVIHFLDPTRDLTPPELTEFEKYIPSAELLELLK